MLLFVVLLVATVVGVRVAMRRRASLSLWWIRTVGPLRPWLSRAVGSTPTFGGLQRAVLADAVRQRTVSVTGSIWLPAVYVVDLAESDQEAVGHAPGPFLSDVAEALTAMASTYGWRLDGAVTLRFADEPTARPGLPKVYVDALTGELAAYGPVSAGVPFSPPAGYEAFDPHPSTAPPAALTTAPPTGPPTGPPMAPATGGHYLTVPRTSRYPHDPGPTSGSGALAPVDLASTELVGEDRTVLVGAGADPGPGLLLDPEDGPGAAIVLSGADTGAVVGRRRPADVVVGEATVSAQHCRLVLDGTRWCIEDLGSSNGTTLNGERIADRRTLSSGDVVELGRSARYRVHL